MDILELKNSTTKIKNLVDVFSSKNGKGIEERTTEAAQSGQQRENKLEKKKSEKNPRDPGDCIKS